MSNFLKAAATGVILLCGCSTLPPKTLLMERVPDQECTIAIVNSIIQNYGARNHEKADIGKGFSSNSAVKTYIYAKLKEKIEILVVDDMTSSNNNSLMLSLIGTQEPTYISDIKQYINDITKCKNDGARNYR